MAHVYGHCDFFKNNFSFTHTNRKMMDEMANHATRVRRWIDKIGDREGRGLHRPRALAREPDRPALAAHPPQPRPEARRGASRSRTSASRASRSTASTCAASSTRPSSSRRSGRRSRTRRSRARSSPSGRSATCCSFLLEHAPLEDWERDILSIVREEAYYFAPQGQTKIMNEGWASYWHSTIMTQQGAHATPRSSTTPTTTPARWRTRPGALNPYKLGIELFRDIEDRWNKGRFGKEWDECDDLRARRRGTRSSALGREKIFEVRKHYNDVTFIDDVPHRRVRDRAEAVRLRLQREAEQLGDPRPRVPEGEEEAAPAAHQLRPADHRGRRRQLREPRRAAARAQARRRGPQAATTPRRRSGTCTRSGGARCNLVTRSTARA